MASPLEIQSKTQLIEGRMRQSFLELREKYHNGEIKTRTEYLYEISRRLRGFYEGIGKPTMQVRPADRMPRSQDYNNMLVEIYKDLGILYSEAEQIMDALKESFLQMEIDRRSLDQQLKELGEKMKSVDAKMNHSDSKVFRDSFIDQSNYDQDMSKDMTAHVWTREGALTLMPRTAEDYTEDASIQIVDGNGLPGNTKQVRSIGGELKFVGEENLHINLADVLDSNADTWFEYESFEFTPKVSLDTGDIGFEYNEGISWRMRQGESLELQMEIQLEKVRPMNWLSLNPFIPNDKGASPASISSIELHDGKGGVYHPLKESSSFGSEKIFLFGRQDCKRIVITFKQPNAYETQAGHLFYKEMEQQKTNYLGKAKYHEGKRIHGPMPSIENLGVMYDPEEKKVVYAAAKYGDVIKSENEYKNKLFMVPKPDSKNPGVQSGFESLTGYRYVIGLRDIGLSNYQFERSSEYVSRSYLSEEEILSVSLTVDDEVPKEFGEGEWITYWISPDEGQNWYRIHPRGARLENAKLLYLFNTNTPNEGRIDAFGYVETTEPVKSVRLKIHLERPEGIEHATYYTPIVKEYEIHATTRGDAV